MNTGVPMAVTVTLTPREQATLEMLAGGFTTGEIADELHITVTSATAYVKQVIDRLDARNRTHAVALAYHRGVLLVPHRAA